MLAFLSCWWDRYCGDVALERSLSLKTTFQPRHHQRRSPRATKMPEAPNAAFLADFRSFCPPDVGDLEEPEPQALSSVEPLSALIDEFKFNPYIREKVDKLSLRGYTGWRRVRGDGNCFYRAAGFTLLDALMSRSQQRRSRWVTILLQKLRNLTFAKVHEIRSHRDLIQRLQRLQRDEQWGSTDANGWEETNEEALLESLCDPTGWLDLTIIRALRGLVAQHLRENRATPITEGGLDFETVCCAGGYEGVDDFNARVVEVAGKEAEGVVLDAFAKAVDVGLRVAIVDRTNAALFYSDHNIQGGSSADNAGLVDGIERPIIHLQFRPGHYDVLQFGARAPEPPSRKRRRA